MLVVISVDTNHEGGDVVALGGGSDQHLLGTSLQEGESSSKRVRNEGQQVCKKSEK